MSIFGQSPGQGPNHASGSSVANPTAVYGRGDLQAAFNWLVNQPEHIRKQASDPDRLMTLYYRSSGRPEMARQETVRSETRTEYTRSESARIETEAPVSGQNFISDLRQINEAMRQFDGPGATAPIHTTATPLPPPTYQAPYQQPTYHAPSGAPSAPSPASSVSASGSSLVPTALSGKTQSILAEVREKLNLSSDAEALNALVALGYRSLKPLLG